MKLDRFKVSQRIVGGQALLLVILLAMVTLSIWSLFGIGSNFTEYRRIARNSNLLGQVDAKADDVRASVKDFLLGGEEEHSARVATLLRELEQLIAQTEQSVTNPERRKMLEEVKGIVTDYESLFAQVTKLDQEMDRLTANVLDKIGPEVRLKLDALIDVAAAENDARTGSRSAQLMQDYLLVRLEMQRLLNRRDDKTAATLDERLATLEAAEKSFSELAQIPARRAVVTDIVTGINAYMAGVKQNKEWLLSQTRLTQDRLVPTGDRFTEVTGRLRSSQTAVQDQLGPQVVAGIDTSRTTSIALGIVAVLLGAAVSWIIARSITGPVAALTGTMGRLANADLTVDVPFTHHRDEMGDMARAVEVFKTNGLERQRLEAEQTAQREAREKRAQRLEALMRGFDNQVQSLVGQLGAASTQMRASAQSMSALSEQTSNQSVTVAGAAEQASANVQAVASATEELSASLEEITRRVAESAQVTREAYEKAEHTNETVATLSEAAGRIGTVVQLIQDIAGQTNLLALNATIEAARAGEAGKGFAVVASEVKSLANQTAKATEEISGQVQQVQDATQQAVAAIQSITGTIAKVNEISAAIAAAIEEQGAATQEIARNVQQAAIGTHDVSSTIVCVRSAAGETGTAAIQVLGVASNVQQQSNQLTDVVSTFLADVKAA
ncbi:methyl-accepting chemotaxis protein [Niveispirillum sp. BGYR6]|uniref:methyl-accepting chemotaxis protein n=1 Tax=Niveispirillum sp. BGYR6 TaxID=2971249 RepID=UPI0022B98F82|nr:methyl-accepting chemotaxis protein [Niveispirillum sp. BGYR6]MDG5496560.1 methyl-accepting chemotaxis protein [Niveispirillum sp. BGYR6]